MFILFIYDSLLVKTSHFLQFTPRRPRRTGNRYSIHSKWVTDCCLTPNDLTAICNHSMICFFTIWTRLFLNFMVPTHCNRSPRVDIILIPIQLVCFYSLMMHFDEKIANPNVIVLVWPDGIWNLCFTRHPRRSRWPLQHQCVYYSLQNAMSQAITDEVAI